MGKNSLIHDLTQEGFADTYAQTITYGLLTAAISRTDRSAGADGTFVLAEDIHNMVPITNPFLKEMLESFLKVGGRGTSQQPGLDFDELGVQEVVEMLRSSDIDLPAVLEDFGNRNPGEDPVIRFYEDFLKAYNKELKIKRGVFYTPQPVVSYIVRSVHELLQTEFSLPDGLASIITWGEMAVQMTRAKRPFTIPEGTSPDSHFVVILDPATGTATFLVEVIDIIFRTLAARWKSERLSSAQQQEEWNRYVPAHLLPRLFGYELMMAPYAIAHMKVGLKLHELGYNFESKERVRVYLTNALEPPHDFANRFAFDIPALANEAEAVNAVKSTESFTVVIGNPPYSIASWNDGAWIDDLTEDYKRTVRTEESQIQALSNDYIKFMRFAEWNCFKSGVGIMGIITGHGYLQGTQPRDLRRHLSETFQRIYCLDLHGSIRRANINALEDEPVFQIMTGVAVTLAVRHVMPGFDAGTTLSSLIGSLEHKFIAMNQSTAMQDAMSVNVNRPAPPNYFFGASTTPLELADEYASWMSLPEIFGTGDRRADKEIFWATGFASQQDDLAMSFTREELEQKMQDLGSASLASLQEKYRLCTTDQWNYTNARSFARRGEWKTYVEQVTYRPFDRRWTVANKHVLTIPRAQVMSQLGNDGLNMGLIASRAVNDLRFAHCFVTKEPVDKISISSKTSTNAYVFPVFMRTKSVLYGTSLRSNLSKPFLARATYNSDKNSDETEITLKAFYYVYGIMHSAQYRRLFEEFLKQDFARVPLTKNEGLYTKVSGLGHALVDAHLLNDAATDVRTVPPVGSGAWIVERPSFSKGTIWIDRATSVGFPCVREDVWAFQIGGYQVCEKWLKDRKGRALSAEDVVHYGRTINAISKTIRIMSEVDTVIEEHGGWPGAFV